MTDPTPAAERRMTTLMIVLSFLGALFFVALTTFVLTGIAWQDAAVQAGKAEYYMDFEHHRIWRWKP
jgi:hypothetical protein